MKLLYCQDCGDIVAPFREARKIRNCVCGRHAVWWEDPLGGVLRAHDRQGREGWPGKEARAWVLGVTNTFLEFPWTMKAEDVDQVIDAHGPTYLFRQRRNCIIRIRPGETGDTRWDSLPTAPTDQEGPR